jgi:hypothetical protein
MAALLGEVYGGLTSLVTDLDDEGLSRPSRAAEWSIKELLFHQMLDAQRALITFATPAGPGEQPDVDEATYWRGYRPSPEDTWSVRHARYVVRSVAAYDDLRSLVAQWTATSRAAARAADAAESADPGALVSTQGHVLTVADFVSTLLVEATVHLLDAWGDPPPEALTQTIRVLERIHGGPLPSAATDADTVLEATGRVPSSHPAYPLLG